MPDRRLGARRRRLMCGIGGALDARGGGTAISHQLSTLKHRGPDAQGAFERPGVAVGQARLSIVDLATGDPPIVEESGDIGVALNGEIYNYLDLRAELRRAGHDLHTRGDTEVIAHLAEDHSPVALAQRLDGMFAFAIWDDRKGELILGRDRLGKKPLYYWSGSGRFVFGSEIKAVLADPAVPRQPNPAALSAYLTFGYVPSPQTFFDGILSVPPGHVLRVRRGSDPIIEPYWSLPGADAAEPLDLTFGEAALETLRLLTSAVERRLMADVPLGAFLSGGVDSSSVVALMAGLSDKPVSTFTIGFDGSDGFDERRYARSVAERFQTDHHEFVVKPDAAELVERLVWHHDQPFGDSSALPTFLLSELTAGHVKVALGGDGGDELFAGYSRFGAARLRRRLQRFPPRSRAGFLAIAKALQRTNPGAFRTLQRFLAHPYGGVSDAYLSWVSPFGPGWRDLLLPGANDWAADGFNRMWNDAGGRSPLDRLLTLNLQTYLLDDLLPKVDRMSMAHGLEVRSPFLDTALLEFALRLPDHAHIRGLSLKRTLKTAVKDLLPPEITRRRKHGFGVPLDRWFRTDLQGYLRSTLCKPSAHVRRHLQGDAVDQMVSEHQEGAGQNGHALWALLTLEIFLARENW